jgi:hypothetical protein
MLLEVAMKHDVWSVQKWLGYLFEEEVIALQEFAEKLPDGAVVVNIGAGGGTSGLLFAEKLGERGRLYTVDIQDESSPYGCLEGEREVFKSAGLDHLAGKHWFQIHGNSIHVGDWWKGHGLPIDFLFIDGDHSYEGCAGDIKAWLPHIKIGGYLAVHDYNKQLLSFKDDGKVKPAPRPWTGVNDAVDNLLIPNMKMSCLAQSLIVFEVAEDSVGKVLGESKA